MNHLFYLSSPFHFQISLHLIESVFSSIYYMISTGSPLILSSMLFGWSDLEVQCPYEEITYCV